MAEVGVAFVSIVPSAKGFGAALNSQTSGAAATAGSTGGKKFGGTFASSMKGLVGPALLVGLGAAASGLIKGAIGEAREAQKVGAITAQVIKTTGGVANVTAGQVSKLSTAISNKTGVDDEAIQKGSNLLLTFKNVRNEVGKGNKIFNQATQAAVDLSAAGFGSIDSASKMLGKALNDPVKGMTALGRAGVTFTKGQQKQIKAMVKSGDLLGAQKIILGEVKSQVGGAGAASATAGEKMKVAWDNAKESLGTALLPAIDSLQKAITTHVIPAIVSFIGFLQKNPTIVKAFAIAVAAIAAAFVIAFIAANALIIGIGLLVAAIVVAVMWIVQNWDKIKAKTVEIWGAIVAFLKGVWNGIKAAAAAVWNGIKSFFSAIWKGIKSVFWGVVNGIVNFLKTRWNNLKTNTSAAFNAVKNFITKAITTAWQFIKDKVAGIVKTFKELPGKIKSGLGNLGKLLVNAGKDIIGGLVRGIKAAGSAIGKALISVLPGPIKKFAHFLGLASPSKLFQQYGEWTVQGYVEGVDRKRHTVATALGSLADVTVGAGPGIGARFSSSNLATPGSGAPWTASLAPGAVVEVAKDGIVRLVKAEIRFNNDAGAMAARYG